MSSEWVQTCWGEISTLHYGKRLSNYKKTNGKYDVYSSAGIVGTCDQYLCPKSGIIVGRKGNLGFHYSDKPFFVIDTAFWLETSEIVDEKWSYYKLISEDISYLDSGSVIPSISRDSFYSLPVLLPSLNEQKKVAEILTALENKIELNKKNNETLEDIAKALFKSWFIDFDPVKAKIEGRSTGLPDEISNLFPDSFEDSELGEIPVGWQIESFADHFNIWGGGTPKTSIEEYWNGDLCWFSIVDVPSDCDCWVLNTQKTITHEGLKRCSSNLFRTGTTIISARGTVGKVCLTGRSMAMNQSCYAIQSKHSDQDIYCFYSTKGIVEILRRRSHGSVFNTITRDTLQGVDLCFSDEKVINTFEKTTKLLMEKIKSNIYESIFLKKIRNALLPQLISGELRVPDAEIILEEVANL